MYGLRPSLRKIQFLHSLVERERLSTQELSINCSRLEINLVQDANSPKQGNEMKYCSFTYLNNLQGKWITLSKLANKSTTHYPQATPFIPIRVLFYFILSCRNAEMRKKPIPKSSLTGLNPVNCREVLRDISFNLWAWILGKVVAVLIKGQKRGLSGGLGLQITEIFPGHVLAGVRVKGNRLMMDNGGSILYSTLPTPAVGHRGRRN